MKSARLLKMGFYVEFLELTVNFIFPLPPLVMNKWWGLALAVLQASLKDYSVISDNSVL